MHYKKIISKLSLVLSLYATLLIGCHQAEPNNQDETPKLEATIPMRENTSIINPALKYPVRRMQRKGV